MHQKTVSWYYRKIDSDAHLSRLQDDQVCRCFTHTQRSNVQAFSCTEPMVKITWTSLTQMYLALIWFDCHDNKTHTHTHKQAYSSCFWMTISVIQWHNNMGTTWLRVCGKTEVHTLYVCLHIIVGCSGIKWCCSSLQPAEHPLSHCPLQLRQKEAKTINTLSIQCSVVSFRTAWLTLQHGRLKGINSLFRGISEHQSSEFQVIMHSENIRNIKSLHTGS